MDIDTLDMKMALWKNNASTTVSVFTNSLLGQLTNTCNSAGYKGAKGLTSKVVKSTATSSAIFSAGTVIFSASSAGDINSIQYAVIYESAGGKLLCFCRLSSAAFNVTTGNTLSVQNPSGVFVLSGGTAE